MAGMKGDFYLSGNDSGSDTANSRVYQVKRGRPHLHRGTVPEIRASGRTATQSRTPVWLRLASPLTWTRATQRPIGTTTWCAGSTTDGFVKTVAIVPRRKPLGECPPFSRRAPRAV